MELSDHERSWLIQQGAEMIRALGVKEGDSVIDFGCGKGRYSIPISQVVRKRGAVLAVEHDPNEAAVLHERIDEFGGQGRITILNSADIRLPSVADGTVDSVFVFDVLQYINDAETFFESVHRVLNPRGALYIYPATIPHPGAVDIARITAIIRKAGLQECDHTNFRMMHSGDLINDDVYTFCRSDLQDNP